MPIDSIIKVFGTGDISTTTNDVAAIDIPEDGLILGVMGTVSGAVGDEGELQAELSFLSTNQFQVNDARASIMEVNHMAGNLTTSGIPEGSTQIWMSIPDGIPVSAGERIHMHTRASTGNTPTGSFQLYLTFTPGTGRRSQRRR